MNRLVIALTGLLLATVLLSTSFAAVPNLVNFQGRLTTAGVPVADSTYTVVFSIFDAPVGGQLIWSETHTDVAVSQGLFSVVLGSLVPLEDSLFNSPTRYLEVKVGAETILPRSQLTSVGYAQRVATVDGATAGNVTGNLTILQPGGTGRIVVGFTDSLGGMPFENAAITSAKISLYEPIDSRVRPGATGERKSMEISGGQIVVFGSTEQDTNLVVSPNGDIVGVGQITMGMNSSSGTQTSVLGFQNTAQGDSSTIGGGSANRTSGTISVIAGGHANEVTSEGGTIGGGARNLVTGPYASIPGGSDDTASGSHAVAAAGESNAADGDWSFAAGRRAKARTHGSFVWADHEDADFASTGEDQFILRAHGGVGINTDSPMGALEVSGPAGDSTVNLPNSSVAAPEILDEPGLAASVTSGVIVLVQHASVPQELTRVTITLPSPGYVLLRGSATLKTHGSSQRNQAYLQIAETPSSSLLPSARLAGPGENDSPNKDHYFDLDVDQIYFRPAGTYTFYLEGLAHPLNGSGASTALDRPTLIATYFPTSYGVVSGFVTSQESSQFNTVEPVLWPNAEDGISSVVNDQYYKADLRELELAVMRAQTQAAILEKQLLEAKLQQATNPAR
ncbi:hypothetical protein C3F09_12305 [candidate division GN15 bacterium]|uniref:Peptidase S74 domain-containing protein n=1 Tax=candidate division GN15 bacterium TaxID=2072418 RepID=A0A855X2C9_9BACT|nr:MAG: hypothetical protein C3F09_12305 [candidate division GN15 bacterium]